LWFHTRQTINEEALLECIKELVRLDKDWVPQGKGYSLYLRPCMIGTQVQNTAELCAAATPSS
jgi:branched-subunit amino acid aminotransferase/4-amino-4-deoxychorismate lyase